MAINPKALLQIIAALTPLMGNKEIGEGMQNEIRMMFNSINNSARVHQAIAQALIDINRRLENLERAHNVEAPDMPVMAIASHAPEEAVL